MQVLPYEFARGRSFELDHEPLGRESVLAQYQVNMVGKNCTGEDSRSGPIGVLGKSLADGTGLYTTELNGGPF